MYQRFLPLLARDLERVGFCIGCCVLHGTRSTCPYVCASEDGYLGDDEMERNRRTGEKMWVRDESMLALGEKYLGNANKQQENDDVDTESDTFDSSVVVGPMVNETKSWLPSCSKHEQVNHVGVHHTYSDEDDDKAQDTWVVAKALNLKSGRPGFKEIRKVIHELLSGQAKLGLLRRD
jgi:hypothetical protein